MIPTHQKLFIIKDSIFILLSQMPPTYLNVLPLFLHIIPTCLTPCHDHNIHRVVCGQTCKQYFLCLDGVFLCAFLWFSYFQRQLTEYKGVMKRVDCQLITNDVVGGGGVTEGEGNVKNTTEPYGGGGGNQVNFNVTQLKSSKCPGDK